MIGNEQRSVGVVRGMHPVTGRGKKHQVAEQRQETGRGGSASGQDTILSYSMRANLTESASNARCTLLRVTTALLLLITCADSAFAEPRIDRMEPLCLTIGETTEVTVFGDRLSEENFPTLIWSGFPAEWQLLKTDTELNRRELKYRVTVPKEVDAGPGAVRVATNSGISPPFLLLLDAGRSTVSFQLSNSEPSVYSFEATQGQSLYCEAWSRRLHQDTDLVMSLHDADGNKIASADDDEVLGFDPNLRFTAPQTGTYTLQVHDNQWRAGSHCCVRVAGEPLVKFGPTDEAMKTSADPKRIPVHLAAGQYLTVTPRTRAIGSPAMLLMELQDDAGRRLAQCGTGDVSDEPLRYKADRTGDFQLIVRDLIERSDLPCELRVSTDEAPFLAQLDGGARDCHVVAAGRQFKIRFRATRFGYNGPIAIECPDLDLSENQIPENRNDIEVKIKVSKDAVPGTLLTFQFRAVAEIEGKSFETSVQTIRQLDKNPPSLTQWPASVDGTCYAIITEGGKSK